MAMESGDRLALPSILTTLGQAYVSAGDVQEGGLSLIEARDHYLLMGLEAKAAALTREIQRLQEAAFSPEARSQQRPADHHR
jgi:hypothetical protein